MNTVDRIEPITLSMVRQVLTSAHITDSKKVQFLKNNKIEISNILKDKITTTEFQTMMENRPLIKFRPFKNAFTKRGDKILLAKSLDIPVEKVDDNIKTFVDNIFNKELSPNAKEKIKTYIYRHGTKAQLLATLEWELSDTKDILTTLYKTLMYNTGGLADYYVRPIHRMDNLTLTRTFNIIDKHLHNATLNNGITDIEKEDASRWALYRIYEIQNNSKLINALKVDNKLK